MPSLWTETDAGPNSAICRAWRDIAKELTPSSVPLGIKFLTLYAFSTENWSRPKEEIDGLMDLLCKTLDTYTGEAQTKNYRLLVSGAQEERPPAVLEKIEKAVQTTAANTGLTVNLALNYGARQEIVHAVNTLLRKGKKIISIDDISAHLYQPAVPDPELIIRTSGEERLSNFLLWQAAYSEFYFTPVLWPDFNAQELQKALDAYAQRTRRFGGV